MEVSGYLDAAAALPTGREPYVSFQQRVWSVWTFRRREKFHIPSGNETDLSVSRALPSQSLGYPGPFTVYNTTLLHTNVTRFYVKSYDVSFSQFMYGITLVLGTKKGRVR